MRVYYNENNSFAAEWLERLIAHGLLPHGVVDKRSIEDVEPDDLIGFDQCHFFAGIGGWPLALRMAGWDDSYPVWTGSCPCQPFSAAGKRSGVSDERHLWPDFDRLIKKRRPPVIFGEQVSSSDGLAWLDHVQTDLEAKDYAVGAFDLCAAGVEADHLRQRLYFVADSDDIRHESILSRVNEADRRDGSDRQSWVGLKCGGAVDEPGDANKQGLERWEGVQLPSEGAIGANGMVNPLVEPEGEQMGIPRCSRIEREAVFCTDGKWRAIEPGTFPLVTTIPDRVGALRGYGNAIYIPLAVEFIKSYMDIIGME